MFQDPPTPSSALTRLKKWESSPETHDAQGETQRVSQHFAPSVPYSTATPSARKQEAVQIGGVVLSGCVHRTRKLQD